ncbi:MAG: sulfurtransferase [Gammaproteobacteria bacterium]|nr:sulfurtransferase [Gammaproteobacteria bacterium]
MQEIDPARAQAMMEAGTGTVLLDVREPWELKIAALPAAVHIPMQDVPDRLSELAADRDLIVVCHHGNRSRVVARYLEQNGFGRVFNLAGGIDAWAQQLEPGMAEY